MNGLLASFIISNFLNKTTSFAFPLARADHFYLHEICAIFSSSNCLAFIDYVLIFCTVVNMDVGRIALRRGQQKGRVQWFIELDLYVMQLEFSHYLPRYYQFNYQYNFCLVLLYFNYEMKPK